MNIRISDAIASLRPTAVYLFRGDTYDGLDWQDLVQTKPTEKEVNDELTRLNGLFPSREAYLSLIDSKDRYNSGKLERAIALTMLDQINLVRSKLVPALPPITVAQLKTAIENKLDSL